MNTRPRSTAHRSRRDIVPAPVAVPARAAGAERAATPPTAPDTARKTLSVPVGPGPVIGSLCTGYGGLDVGVLAALGGGRIAWCADPDPHIQLILAARMPGVPNLGDVRAIDWTRVEPVDVLTAGFPCQDISAAGRRVGIEKGARSGLWTDIVAGIRLLRPALVVVENVAALRWRNGGLHRVLGDLAETGYDALWRSVRAADIGAAHRRERVFLLAWPRTGAGAAVTHPASARRRQPRPRRPSTAPSRWAPSEPPRRGRRGDETAAHTDGLGREELHPQDPGRWAVAARRGPAATDPAGDRRDQGLPGATRFQRGPDAALSGRAAAHPGHRRHLVAVPNPADHEPARPATADPPMDWGDYAPAVRRWEQVLGRGAPFPTQPGQHGRPVLAPVFVEWLQGLEPGWVTGLALPRTAQLRALGNGVLPQQAAHAIGLLLADLTALLGHSPSTGEEVRAA
jgi:DNA (cytosine-5)-methyltransferase 1